MQFQKQVSVGGAWLKGKEVVSGTRAVLVSEAQEVPSQFKDEKTGASKMQVVAKILLEGQEEAVNLNINRPSVNGLVDAFGTDSNSWIKQPLTIHTERVIVSGKRVTAVYLVPDGYELKEDQEGFVQVVKKGGVVADADIPVVKTEDEDLPF